MIFCLYFRPRNVYHKSKATNNKTITTKKKKKKNYRRKKADFYTPGTCMPVKWYMAYNGMNIGFMRSLVSMCLFLSHTHYHSLPPSLCFFSCFFIVWFPSCSCRSLFPDNKICIRKGEFSPDFIFLSINKNISKILSPQLLKLTLSFGCCVCI